MTKQLIAIFDLDRTLYDDRERMEKYAPKDLVAAAQDDSLWDEYHAHHDEDEFIPYTKEKALKLQAEGAILYFVTYRGEEHRQRTLEVLEMEGLAGISSQLFMRPTGTKPKMPEFRVEQVRAVWEYAIAQDLDLDIEFEFVFFDDNLDNCRAVVDSGLVGRVEHVISGLDNDVFLSYPVMIGCDQSLQGKRVRKTGGSFEHTGTVVSEFKTLAGEPRIVLEFDEPVAGMLHVYRPDQVTVI